MHNIIFCIFTPTPYFQDISTLKTEEKTPQKQLLAIIIGIHYQSQLGF